MIINYHGQISLLDPNSLDLVVVVRLRHRIFPVCITQEGILISIEGFVFSVNFDATHLGFSETEKLAEDTSNHINKLCHWWSRHQLISKISTPRSENWYLWIYWDEYVSSSSIQNGTWDSDHDYQVTQLLPAF